MAVDVTLNTIATGFNLSQLNENFDIIDAALQDAVSRSATTPNTMTADLDMNSQKLINLADPTQNQEAVTKAFGDANYGGAVSIAAAASAAAALVSEGNAATSETNAATSAGNAATSEANAATSETNAGISETNAALSASVAINTVVPTQVFSGTGSQTVFTLSRTVVDSTSILVTVDGVKQHTATYTATATTLTFTIAPPSGTSNIEVVFIGFSGLIADLGLIPNDALSGDMISGGTIDTVSILANSMNIGLIDGTSNLTIKQGAGFGHFNGANTALDSTFPFIASLNNANVDAATLGWMWYDDSATGDMTMMRRSGTTVGTVVQIFDRGTGQMRMPDGSAAIPAVSFISDINSGLFSVGADIVGISAGAFEVARFGLAGNIITQPSNFIALNVQATNTGQQKEVLKIQRTTSTSFADVNTPMMRLVNANSSGDTTTMRYETSATHNAFGIISGSNQSHTLRLNITGAPVDFGWSSTGQSLWPAGTVTAPSYSFQGDIDTGFYNPGANSLRIATAGQERIHFAGNGDILMNNSVALATTAVDRFFMLQGMAGTPTGNPTNDGLGANPIIVDTANDRLYVRVNGVWKFATLT